MSHKLNHLSFGNKTEATTLESKYRRKIINELDGATIEQSQHVPFAQMHLEYVIDITEVEYEDSTRTIIKAPGSIGHPKYAGYQYRAMRTILMTGGMGGVWFKYDISPIKIHYTLYLG